MNTKEGKENRNKLYPTLLKVNSTSIGNIKKQLKNKISVSTFNLYSKFSYRDARNHINDHLQKEDNRMDK